MVSNTFSTPSAATALILARGFWNNSHKALATNFYGPARPTSSNYLLEGVATTPDDGLLWRNSTNGVLYIKDYNFTKGGAGSFTVNGIGSRIIEDLSSYSSSDYEVGELFKTVGANSRLYMKTSNAGIIVDIGIPPNNGSITTNMIGNGQVTGQKLSSNVGVTDSSRVWTAAQKFDIDNQDTYLTSAVQLYSDFGNTSISFNTINSSAMVSHNASSSALTVTDGLNNPYTIRAAEFKKFESESGSFGDLLPPGVVLPFAGSSAPVGWFICDGTAINRTTYATLFALIGTIYGVGDGSTTFNIPNLQNKSVVGAGNMTLGTTSSTSVNSSGETTSGGGGSHDHTNVTTTVAASAKDSTTTNVLTDVQPESGHTHTITNPVTALNYIIKY